jgi:hypothetical protein
MTCPRGYILVLEAASAISSARPGVCTLCGAGTYSVDPLYGGSRTITGEEQDVEDSESPKCLPCPAGGVCFGGDKVMQLS